jgi:hypothetical protein
MAALTGSLRAFIRSSWQKNSKLLLIYENNVVLLQPYFENQKENIITT